METRICSKEQFNLDLLLALDCIEPTLKHTSSGSKYGHPLLRIVLLRAVREDIEADGLAHTFNKWKDFVYPSLAQMLLSKD